jgi:hypothetical protein
MNHRDAVLMNAKLMNAEHTETQRKIYETLINLFVCVCVLHMFMLVNFVYYEVEQKVHKCTLSHLALSHLALKSIYCECFCKIFSVPSCLCGKYSYERIPTTYLV